MSGSIYSTGGLVGLKNGGSFITTYWNNMSPQTAGGGSRSETQKLGIGSDSTSTSNSSANGVTALSTTNFFTNTFLKAV